MLVGAGMFVLCSCTSQGSQQKEVVTDSVSVSQVDPVIETIMSRRSIRKYKPEAVEREKMQTIVECGINAPNGMNKQSWEVRVVDNPEFINGLTEIFKKENPKAAERPGFQNMFNNAPTVVFIANDPAYDMSQIDCGLLGENMILSAWSMGIGSCCLGGPVRFMKSPAAAEYMKQLGFSEGYELLHITELLRSEPDRYRPVLNGDRYITEAELSESLKITRRTLVEHRTTGLIPYPAWA